MKQFNYRALDKGGKNVSGLIEALGEKQAVRTLQERGLVIVSLSEKRDLFGKLQSYFKFANRVSPREVTVFTRLLATMLSTGLPLVDALSNLTAQTNGYFREVIRGIQNDVAAGISLSESMGRNPDIFSDLYINLVKAGEASGKVSEVLEKLADTMEADLEFRAKVKGAMIYPSIIFFAMTAIGIFMMTTIIPQISKIYTEFGAELPLPTKILIGISNTITGYFPVVVVLFGLAFFTFRTLKNNKASEYMINNFLYKIPVFGPLSQDAVLAVMNRTLGTLLSSGVAIIDSLKIVSGTMANDHYRAGVEAAVHEVERGLPLSQSLRRNPIFPVMMGQLTAIGEETGTVDQSLSRLAKFYEDSAERKVKTVTTALEPLMILMMGLTVGGLAIAVLLPMFNLVSIIK